MISIRKAAETESQDVVQRSIHCLVDAFSQVDVNMLLCGNSVEAMRIRSKLRVKRSLARCDVYLAESEDGDVAGIAIWVPPSRGDTPKETQDTEEDEEDERKFTSMISPELAAWLDGELATESERLTEEAFGEQGKTSWELTILGVNPAYQGQGLARRLIEPGMKKAWSENRAVILDTGNKNVVKMYERFGFGVRGETTYCIPGTSAPTTWWAMLAAPQKI